MIRTLLLASRGNDLPAELDAAMRRIAELYRSRLILASVRNPDAISAVQPPGAAADTEAGEPDSPQPRCEVRPVILAGSFIEAVCDKGHEADVIVVWHACLCGPDGQLVAEDVSNLVRQAPRPIWIAREPIRVPEHIMVAYDGSAHSGRALHVSANLAETLGAKLTVLNVDESRDEVAQELILSRAAGYCEPYRINMERVGVFGTAAASIHAFAASSQCDLLVLGAAGVGYLRGLLFGSVTGQLITNAPCSVLVAK